MKKDTFIVEGLAGKKALNGEVRINGAKNAALKVMAASVLFDGPIRLTNAPHTEDTSRMAELLTGLGAKVTFNGKGHEREIIIDASDLTSTDLDPDLTKSMRSSVLLTGPILARYGKATFPLPGGCVIGPRPIDLFVTAYEKLGIHVKLEGGNSDAGKNGKNVKNASGDDERYVMKADKMKGAEIFWNIQSVTGTETLMMTATLTPGKTTLKNCAMEPEIASLADFLNAHGAKISGAGTTTIEIEGVKVLSSKVKGNAQYETKDGAKVPATYVTMPDRVETGSFLLLGALCADNLKITHCDPSNLEVLINMLRESGVPIFTTKNTIEIRDNGKIKNNSFKPFNIRTHEYPGFSTDLQAPATVYLTQVSGEAINPNSSARGESIVFETIYEGRLKFVSNLEKLGAQITVMNPREILVKGNPNTAGVGTVQSNSYFKAIDPKGEAAPELDAFDIRAGFATVMATLLATGTSVISNVYFIDRGYENLEGRLSALGANVQRVHAEDSAAV